MATAPRPDVLSRHLVWVAPEFGLDPEVGQWETQLDVTANAARWLRLRGLLQTYSTPRQQSTVDFDFFHGSRVGFRSSASRAENAPASPSVPAPARPCR